MKNLNSFTFEPATPYMSQHFATHHNRVTKRAQHVALNNVAISCVEMLRSFGRGLVIFSKQNLNVSQLWLLIDVEITRNCTSSSAYQSDVLTSSPYEIGPTFSQEEFRRLNPVNQLKRKLHLCAANKGSGWIRPQRPQNTRNGLLRAPIQTIADFFKDDCGTISFSD